VYSNINLLNSIGLNSGNNNNNLFSLNKLNNLVVNNATYKAAITRDALREAANPDLNLKTGNNLQLSWALDFVKQFNALDTVPGKANGQFTMDDIKAVVKAGTTDLNKPVPLADIAKGFDTLQNGQPIDPKVLAAAAGTDGILTQAEATKLAGVICVNKKTGEKLPIAECMAKNGVFSINLGTAATAGKLPQYYLDAFKKISTTDVGKVFFNTLDARDGKKDGYINLADAQGYLNDTRAQ
jgi:hypothetical protein